MKNNDSSEVLYSIKLPFEEINWCRDYRLHALPKDEAGAVLYRGSSDFEYHAYLDWLADYLHQVRGNPTKEQAAICACLAGYEPEVAVQLLAMNAANYEAEMVGVELYLIDPETAEEGYYSEKQIQRAKHEEEQRLRYGIEFEDEEEFCDLGWRVPLAWVLMKLPQKEERISLLRGFFRAYQEYSRK